MKKVFYVAITMVVISMFASCAASRGSDCPSHDPNYFRRTR